MKQLILSSSLLATILFFWMVRKELRRELEVLAIEKTKTNYYYPD